MAVKSKKRDDKSYVLSHIKDLNDGVTNLYENLMDDQVADAIKDIDKLTTSLRHLKSNLVTKDKDNEV